MQRKTTIALVAAALWSTVAPHAASAQYCYGTPGVARCAGVGLGLQSSRWYFSDNYPYWIYYYPSRPYPALGSGVGGGGCRLIQRPVLGAHGWRTRTVCD
jgi:hypothetical protein